MRPILPFAIAAVCAVPAAAQQYIPKEFLQAELERQKGIVLKYVDAAPDSMLGFRPTKRNGAEAMPRSGTGSFSCCQQPIQIKEGARAIPYCRSRRGECTRNHRRSPL